MKPLFIKKLKDIVREEISRDNRVELDGVGEFRKVHHKQTQKKNDDGSIVILPPRDSIEFKPEIRPQNDDQ